jgi:hypothetical protein
VLRERMGGGLIDVGVNLTREQKIRIYSVLIIIFILILLTSKFSYLFDYYFSSALLNTELESSIVLSTTGDSSSPAIYFASSQNIDLSKASKGGVNMIAISSNKNEILGTMPPSLEVHPKGNKPILLVTIHEDFTESGILSIQTALISWIKINPELDFQILIFSTNISLTRALVKITSAIGTGTAPINYLLFSLMLCF